MPDGVHTGQFLAVLGGVVGTKQQRTTRGHRRADIRLRTATVASVVRGQLVVIVGLWDFTCGGR